MNRREADRKREAVFWQEKHLREAPHPHPRARGSQGTGRTEKALRMDSAKDNSQVSWAWEGAWGRTAGWWLLDGLSSKLS